MGGWQQKAGGGSGWENPAASGWSGTGGAFAPSMIAGLVLWLAADSGVTTASGAVSQWNDLSPSHNNATQVTALDRPTYNTSDASFNNRPSVTFNGSTQFLSLSSSPLVAPCTVIVCGNTTAQAGQGDILEDGVSTELIVSAAPSQIGAYAGTALVSPIATSSPFVVGAVYNGASSSIYQNAPFAPIVAGTTGAGAVGGASCSIGASTGPSNFFNGTIAEVLVYNSVLSAAQLRQVFAYLQGKYALANVTLDFVNPLSIAGNMMWLNASNVTLGTPPAVASMTDLSGHGNTVVQATPSLQPNLIASAINGLPGVQGNGTTQFLKTAAGLSAVPLAMFAVAQASTDTATARGICGDSPGNFNLLYHPTTGEMSANTNATSITVAVGDTAPHVYGVNMNGASSKLYVDGAGTAGTLTQSVSANDALAICMTGSAFWDGPICEYAAYSRVLTAPEISLVGNYLAAKYAIAGTW